MWFINQAFNATLSAAWKPVRSVYQGARGGANVIKNGEKTHYNPAQLLGRRLKQNTQSMLTGNRYNFKTGEKLDDAHQSWVGKHIGNRIGGAAHLVGDLTLGTMGTTLGWATRPIVAAGWGATKVAAPLAAKGLGHGAWQTAKLGAELGVNGAKTVTAMSRNPVGRQALFWGAGGTMAAASMGDNLLKEQTADKLAFYAGNQVSSLPGTLGESGASSGSSAVLDNMGSDGDLVFSLHNLR